MGTNIQGWVEIRDADVDVLIDEVIWFAVINVHALLRRNYSMFGSLFGVRNHSDFVPVAAGRGLPADASPTTRSEANRSDELHSHTWVSWRELKAVDWNERALAGLAFGYREGEEQYSTGVYLDSSDPRRQQGRTWKDGDATFKVETITRNEAIGSECQMLFELMAILAQQYGDEYVRLVVWFDNHS